MDSTASAHLIGHHAASGLHERVLALNSATEFGGEQMGLMENCAREVVS
jgi:hypothetical protein